jgi:hypothetical protein
MTGGIVAENTSQTIRLAIGSPFGAALAGRSRSLDGGGLILASHSTEGTGNMAGDGSAALGAPEIAGALVNPRGFTKKASVGAIGGALGAVAATAVASRSRAGDLPSFGRVGYVAASDAEVALIRTKSGALKMKVTDEVLARAPREEIARVELDKGRLLSHLRLQFSNGTVWEFDVPKTAAKNAERLVLALGGDIV